VHLNQYSAYSLLFAVTQTETKIKTRNKENIEIFNSICNLKITQSNVMIKIYLKLRETDE